MTKKEKQAIADTYAMYRKAYDHYAEADHYCPTEKYSLDRREAAYAMAVVRDLAEQIGVDVDTATA